jgi:hypothetical protein
VLHAYFWSVSDWQGIPKIEILSKVFTMVLELLFTVLPPVYEGAIFGFYVATFSLLMYGSFSFIQACKYYVFKKEVMYMLAVFIAFLLILVSLLGVSASLMVWTVGTLVHPNQPVLKDWVRFYAMLLVESLIVILFLEIVIGPMRSGKMIFTRASSTTDVSSFFRYFTILLSPTSHH